MIIQTPTPPTPPKNRPEARVSSLFMAGGLFGLFMWVMSPFLLAIMMAAFVAATVEPYFKRVYERQKTLRGAWATGIIFAIYVLFTLPFIIGVTKLVARLNEALRPQGGQSGSQTIQNLMSLKGTIDEKINSLASSVGLQLSGDFQNLTQQAIEKSMTTIVNLTSQFLLQVPDLLLSLFVFTVALFFLLTEGPRMRQVVDDLNIVDSDDLDFLIDVTKRSCRSILLSTLVIGGIQALVVSVSSLILGPGEFFIVFVLTFVFSLIPIIGAAPVAIALSLTKFTSGHVGLGVAWLVIATIAGTIDNVLKPFVIRTEEELHPLITFLAVLGGIYLWGFVGLFVGPLLATLAFAAIPRFLAKAHGQPTLVLHENEIPKTTQNEE
ncbi:MAG: AI-2E family transporter [Bdellovibrionaceae bacterium]|nr:AI-2E family transporter [Pseudobdellovibrionaceae bacterium]MBX3033797.1 AI-2E family transporter [Pseudobdellovibrionaceae bacterium]